MDYLKVPGVLAQCVWSFCFPLPLPIPPFSFSHSDFVRDFDLSLFLSSISSFGDPLLDHFLSFFVYLGIEPGASCILGKHSAPELRPNSDQLSQLI